MTYPGACWITDGPVRCDAKYSLAQQTRRVGELVLAAVRMCPTMRGCRIRDDAMGLDFRWKMVP